MKTYENIIKWYFKNIYDEWKQTAKYQCLRIIWFSVRCSTTPLTLVSSTQILHVWIIAYMNSEKWPHSRENGLVNIPYMEHLGYNTSQRNKPETPGASKKQASWTPSLRWVHAQHLDMLTWLQATAIALPAEEPWWWWWDFFRFEKEVFSSKK